MMSGCFGGAASMTVSRGYSDFAHRRARQVRRIPPSVTIGDGRAGTWPLRSFLEFGALPGAVPCARLHARQVMWEWSLTGLSQNAELVVSELVTNAVEASRGTARPDVRLWLVSDRVQIAIVVWDSSPQPPVRAEISEDVENGRGLLLVEAISEQWGYCFPGEQGSTSTRGHEGKVVWAIVRLSRAARKSPRLEITPSEGVITHDDQPSTAKKGPVPARSQSAGRPRAGARPGPHRHHAA
jgi:anti-sigma regulatory factor (Ser/Thr protein kinase)